MEMDAGRRLYPLYCDCHATSGNVVHKSCKCKFSHKPLYSLYSFYTLAWVWRKTSLGGYDCGHNGRLWCLYAFHSREVPGAAWRCHRVVWLIVLGASFCSAWKIRIQVRLRFICSRTFLHQWL